MTTTNDTGQEALLRHAGIERLTPMQEAACAAYGQKRDMVLLSPTGSGKTLAFLLPLTEALRKDKEGVQAVVLTPSRELALQIEGVFKRLAPPCFKAMSCYGGRPAMDEHRTMRSLRPALLIGTPGRMNDHLGKGNFDAGTVETLVIDEFDKSLELGFQEEMAEVIGRLPGIRKRILLSATDAPEIPRFTGATHCIRLDYRNAEETPMARLELRQVHSPEKDKLETLYRLLCTLGDTSTLVFVNYRESAERVAGYLLARRLPCDTFHGGMEQDERERALYKFRGGSLPVLVATDLAARGLDIEGLENVVHYHLPVNQEAFTHRNGRTARWQARGTSYLILHPEERLPDYLPADTPVCDLPADVPPPPRPRWTTLYISKGKKEKLSKADIAGFLYKKGGLSREDVGPVDVREHHSYVAVRRSKARQLLTLVRGEKIKGMKAIIEEAK